MSPNSDLVKGVRFFRDSSCNFFTLTRVEVENLPFENFPCRFLLLLPRRPSPALHRNLSDSEITEKHKSHVQRD